MLTTQVCRARGGHLPAMAQGRVPWPGHPRMLGTQGPWHRERIECVAVAGCLRIQHRRCRPLFIEHRETNRKVTSHSHPQGPEGQGPWGVVTELLPWDPSSAQPPSPACPHPQPMVVRMT